MKHTICKLQEQIFHLQMKLIEKDLYPGQYRLPEFVLADAVPAVLRSQRLVPKPQPPTPRKRELPPPLQCYLSTVHMLTLPISGFSEKHNKAVPWVTGAPCFHRSLSILLSLGIGQKDQAFG